MSPEHRHKILRLSEDMILQALTNKVTFSGLPDDVTMKNVFYDPSRQCWGLVLEHSSFDEIPLGQMLPEINANVTFTSDSWREKGPLF